MGEVISVLSARLFQSRVGRIHPHAVIRALQRPLSQSLGAVVWLLGTVWCCGAGAELPPVFKDTPRIVRSASLQFITHDLVKPDFAASGAPLFDPTKDTARQQLPETLVRLGGESVGVSAERIKKRFLTILDLPDQWRGTIHLVLRPTERLDEHPRIATTRFSDTWKYRIDIPAVTDALSLVRSVVQVLLIEVANRGSSEKTAEIPLWLLEAITRQIFFEAGRSLLLQPETSVLGTHRHSHPEQVSRNWLMSHPAMTFTDLSFPAHEMLQGDAFLSYESSAHLFFVELSRLPQGSQRMRAFVTNLGEFWNWQTPFFKAFESQFKTPLDVEKWWSVVLLRPSQQAAGMDQSFESSRRKLDEVLQLDSEIRFDPQQIPGKTKLGLAEVIRQWDYPQQRPLLQDKINELTIVQWTVAPDWIPLIQAYRQTLADYLEKRDGAGQAPQQRGGPLPRARYIVDEAVRELESLERQRVARRPASTQENNLAEVLQQKPPRAPKKRAIR